MGYHKTKSYRGSLVEGATDGKYIKTRPDTSDLPSNTAAMERNRDTLNPLNGFLVAEYPAKANPAG